MLILLMPAILATLVALVFAFSMALTPQPPAVRWSLGAFTPIMTFAVFALADPQSGCEYDCPGRALWFSIASGVAVGWIVGYTFGSIRTDDDRRF